MSYRIMSRDLKGYKLDGVGTDRYYADNWKYHIDPKYTSYGDVLVRMKTEHSGFSIKIKVFFRNHWYWKPSFRCRPRWGENYFHWLFFMIWIENVYQDKIDKVVKDHLAEHESINNGK